MVSHEIHPEIIVHRNIKRAQYSQYFISQSYNFNFFSCQDPAIKEIKQLPLLELTSGTQIFSTDAAAKYLFPHTAGGTSVDQWLEWSSTRLAPALAHNLAIGHKADANARPILNQLVQTLNETLQKSLFLTGPKISCADVAVWSLLAPDGTLTGSHDIENVSIWYRTISELAEVKVNDDEADKNSAFKPNLNLFRLRWLNCP